MSKKSASSAGKRASKRSPPRTGRPPGQSSEETRRRILASARDCFVRLGFERATNKHIAFAAGITAAGLYRHFESKAEIYAAVVHESSASQVLRLQKTIKAAPTVSAAFGSILRGLGDETQSADAKFLSGVPTEMQRHPEVAQRMRANPGEIDTILRKLVERGVQTGELSPDKREQTVGLMIASFMGVSAYINALGRAEGEKAVAGLLDLLAGRLFSAPPARAADAATRPR